jgi:alginate O-acetyltransferase complex protein AlgJ
MTAAELQIPEREAQALREVGRTDIGRGLAWLLTAILVATICVVPIMEPTLASLGAGAPTEAGSPHRSVFLEFGRQVVGSREIFENNGLMAANRDLQRAIDQFEGRLEDGSFLRRLLLPPVQELMTGALGLGNEQAYLGRGGSLFYRPDVDYLVGRGFLEAAVLEKRARGGDAWRPPPQPDPLQVLIAFDRELAAQGIRLLVLPTPVKPMLHPESFSRRFSKISEPLQNASFKQFIEQLEAQEIEVVNPAPLLLREWHQSGRPLFLRTDTHWTPGAVDRVARQLADHLQGTPWQMGSTGVLYVRRRVAVENMGDIGVMLRLPAGQELFDRERVETERVLTATGESWRSQPGSEILLLGDSFSNIYSQAELGWGAGAGLAEQLSFHLQRPVEKIALNAGGAYASRQMLRRQSLTSRNPLRGKKVVVYQFAVRELAMGDWRLQGTGLD